MTTTYTERLERIDQLAEQVYEKYGFLRTEEQITHPSIEVMKTATTRYTREWNGYPQTVQITMSVEDVRDIKVKVVGKNARKGGAEYAKKQAIEMYYSYIENVR